MVTLLALHLLGTLDGAFAGYRAWAGRCGLIHRRRLALRAFARGALFAQLALGLVELAAALLVTDPMVFERAGQAMLGAFVPYAGLVALAFLLRAIPSIDVQAATSLLLFGPLTLVRPLVLVAGGVLAVRTDTTPSTVFLAVAVVVAALALGRGLRAGIPAPGA